MREKRQKNQKYDGSMTVEASIVMSVVILSLASLIRYAYTVHDTVTGGMILEETIERVRNNVDKKKIVINENINTLGTYVVTINLHAKVVATLKIKLIKE